jgi:hypothetical protein
VEGQREEHRGELRGQREDKVSGERRNWVPPDHSHRQPETRSCRANVHWRWNFHESRQTLYKKSADFLKKSPDFLKKSPDFSNRATLEQSANFLK